MEVKKFEDGDVAKYVFVKEDACYEAVLYKYPTYEERTVLCISTQCGCPVGCTFCGTGKKFVRNLTADEILDQVVHIFAEEKIDKTLVKKLQIMFMSMGEPLLNYDEVSMAIGDLADMYPNADLLLSTIGPKNIKVLNELLEDSRLIPKIGLQFSIHKAFDVERDELIPFKGKMTLKEIRDYGIDWYATTHRQVYLNYCIDGTNNKVEDADELMKLFSPTAFCFIFSVVCSADETMKDAGYRELDKVRDFEAKFASEGYNTRIFDPAGQDTIGGGCGQLWYVQDWMKKQGK